jgi:uncharacterized OB-fold protein
MSTEQLAYPPRVTEFTATFWNGLRESRFQTTKCLACEHLTFPPKPICPNCWSSAVQWIELRGTGVLRSYTEVCAAPSMFAAEAPYVLGLVDLDEGVRCLSRIDAAWDDLRPDDHVEVRFREAEPAYLFEFVPAERPHHHGDDLRVGEESQP